VPPCPSVASLFNNHTVFPLIWMSVCGGRVSNGPYQSSLWSKKSLIGSSAGEQYSQKMGSAHRRSVCGPFSCLKRAPTKPYLDSMDVTASSSTFPRNFQQTNPAARGGRSRGFFRRYGIASPPPAVELLVARIVRDLIQNLSFLAVYMGILQPTQFLRAIPPQSLGYFFCCSFSLRSLVCR
jgi:hypothetical protein